MIKYITHDLTTAPQASQPLLQSSIDNFGWIPNQSAIMAEAPTLLEAYQRAHDLFKESSLTEEEKAVVWICAGMAHSCNYTIGAHEFIATNNGVSVEYLKALKNNKKLPDKLQALRSFTFIVAKSQGQVSKAQIDDFISAGFTKAQVFEVVLGVAQKTMSNLVNNIAKTEIDDIFESKIA